MNNEQAHQTMRSLRAAFEDFNEHGYLGQPEYMLKSYRDIAIQGLQLVDQLWTHQPGHEALCAYRVFCRKIILRVSSLLNNGRKETDMETIEFFASMDQPTWARTLQ